MGDSSIVMSTETGEVKSVTAKGRVGKQCQSTLWGRRGAGKEERWGTIGRGLETETEILFKK